MDENLKNESSWGGARTGAGRPSGSTNKSTKEKKAVEEELKQRIMDVADVLFNSQLQLARGEHYLYKIEKEWVKTGKGADTGYWRKKPATQVTTQWEIEAYLQGVVEDAPLESEGDTYYFIVTKDPSNGAIDSMWNRAIGKVRQNVGLDGGDDGVPIMFIPSEIAKKNDINTTTENNSGG